MQPYPFVRLRDTIEDRRSRGLPVYDFSTGDPFEPTPAVVRQALIAGLEDVCRYPSVRGRHETRQAIADWVQTRFGCRLDPDREIIPSSGSKEAIFHTAMAFVPREGRRRTVLYPTPGYPVYAAGACLVGAKPRAYVLREQGGFLPELDRIPGELLDETAVFWLNSPHNPTGAVIDRGLLAELVAAARQHGFLLAADECYADVFFAEPPASVLELGCESVLAFHSLSKRSGMTGYRSGFVAGDARAISRYLALRPNLGVASPDFIQSAAIAAWSDLEHAETRRRLFATKRQLFLRLFADLGWAVCASEATFYLWVKVPPDIDEEALVPRLLERGIVISPGSVFGPAGRGFFRLALVPRQQECEAAVRAWQELYPPARPT